MLAQPPASPAPEPSLESVARLMETAAAADGDAVLFAVSQLLSAVGYAATDRDPLPFAELESSCHRIANLWLIRGAR